jgi:hypothetical protein
LTAARNDRNTIAHVTQGINMVLVYGTTHWAFYPAMSAVLFHLRVKKE